MTANHLSFAVDNFPQNHPPVHSLISLPITSDIKLPFSSHIQFLSYSLYRNSPHIFNFRRVHNNSPLTPKFLWGFWILLNMSVVEITVLLFISSSYNWTLLRPFISFTVQGPHSNFNFWCFCLGKQHTTSPGSTWSTILDRHFLCLILSLLFDIHHDSIHIFSVHVSTAFWYHLFANSNVAFF